ncbi:MAG TPA: ATP-binding protein [Azospirillaceae bacterium]|nr:ATP-binding protein [Azospirillaceae bacterium]
MPDTAQSASLDLLPSASGAAGDGRSLAILGGGLSAIAALAAAILGFVGWATAAGVAGLAAVAAVGVATVAIRRVILSDAQARNGLELMVRAFEDGPPRALTDRTGRIVRMNAAARRLIPPGAASPIPRLIATGTEDASRLEALMASAVAGRSATVLVAGAQAGTIRVSAEPSGDGLVLWRMEPTAGGAPELDPGVEQVLDGFPFGILLADPGGRVTFANLPLARALGLDRRTLPRSAVRLDALVVPPPGWDGRSDAGPARSELVLSGADGFKVYADVVIGARRHGGTCLVAVDLAVDQDRQGALRRSEHRFQRLFDDSPTGIALVDATDRLLECNPAFQQMTGGDARLGRPVAELLLPDDMQEAGARLAQARDGTDPNAPFEVRLAGPGERVLRLYAGRLGGAAGDGTLVLHAIDLTEQKRLETQFVQGQKMQAVGQLAGGVAHDFNNLLTAMIGFCDLLLLRHKPGDQSFSDIMQIKQNANRAANLVRQLLAFSRQQTLQPKVLSITDVLAELSNLLHRLIGENIELRMVHGRDTGLVKVDQGQLEQVIINLAVNARDAMPNGGQLTIGTRNMTLDMPLRRNSEEVPAGEYVAIEVVDTGIGIPPENLARIFEPFFSTKEVGSGTGLGLSTVYGIVRQTGGIVLVDSAPGAGATFTILLPRWKGEEQKLPAVVEQMPGDLTGAGTILLVEDEDAVRVFSARALRNKGYNVMEARSGEAALELLKANAGRIDLLISDVVMPQMDGPTLVRRVRETLPNLKVIFISGYAEDRFRRNLDPGTVVQFLPKPYSLKQLAAKVKDVMAGGG